MDCFASLAMTEKTCRYSANIETGKNSRNPAARFSTQRRQQARHQTAALGETVDLDMFVERMSVGTTNAHGCEFLEEPESLPASSTRLVSSGGSGSGSVRRSSRRLAIARSVSMPTTLPPLHRHRGSRPESTN